LTPTGQLHDAGAAGLLEQAPGPRRSPSRADGWTRRRPARLRWVHLTSMRRSAAAGAGRRFADRPYRKAAPTPLGPLLEGLPRRGATGDLLACHRRSRRVARRARRGHARHFAYSDAARPSCLARRASSRRGSAPPARHGHSAHDPGRARRARAGRTPGRNSSWCGAETTATFRGLVGSPDRGWALPKA
jgi:hypothetical protein